MKFRKPMLAKSFNGDFSKIQFPCFAQPKLDGIRCVTDGQTFWSRNGKKFPAINLKHLQTPKSLGVLIDGELMVEESEYFEDIVSAVKNGSTLDRSLSARIRLHVFDIVDSNPFHLRRLEAAVYVNYAQERDARWEIVPSVRVSKIKELKSASNRFLEAGYEGTMIRTPKGLYVGKRTNDLLKWKPLLEAEFEIIGVKEAKGKDAGTPIFICNANKKAGNFRARPMGTMKQRRKMWRQRKRLIGQLLTVKFQSLTKYGKPKFPRAKVLRDYE